MMFGVPSLVSLIGYCRLIFMSFNFSRSITRAINPSLFALGLGSFAIGTTEFAPMGLLPNIADGLSVSIPHAGMLVTAYALGVMIGAPVITLLVDRLSRRTALLYLMLVFILGNLVSFLAPNFFSLMAGRIITSLCQGAFFGCGAVVATMVVPKEKQGSAIATMFMGLSIANIIGVPAVAWVGQHLSWRMAFGAIVLLGMLAFFGLARALPKDVRTERSNVRKELASVLSLNMAISMVLTVMFAGAFFSLYTYIAPFLDNRIQASSDFISVSLIIVGLGLTVGNWLGGRLSDWSLDGSLILGLLCLMGSLFLVPFFAVSDTGALVILFVWAVSAFVVVPPLQVRAMKAAENAPSLAAAINIAGFNLGNALGASVGGGVISTGLGYPSVSFAGGVMALIALVVLIVWRMTRVSSARLVSRSGTVS